MVNVKDFISKYYSEASPAAVNNVESYIRHLETIIENRTIEDALTDKKILCKSFYTQNAGSISKAHYYRVKGYILNLLEYFGIDNKITPPTHQEVLSDREKIIYFRDLDDLLRLIDAVGRYRLDSYDPMTDLMLIKSLVVLSWYGFSSQEIMTMEISSVKDVDNQSVVVFGEKRIKLEERHLKILQRFASVDSYHGLPNGRLIMLNTNSNLLFRPAGTSTTLRKEYLTQALDRFNASIPVTMNFAIYFRILRKNALFLEVYNDKSDIPLQKKIGLHTKCSRALKFGYLREYTYWVNLYHGAKK